MKDQTTTISQISAAVSSFVDLYNHVDLLLNDIKFKEPEAMELQADLRLLPVLIIEILPMLNTGNTLHDRNFYRVLKLMCKALEEARDTLDGYMISAVAALLQSRTFYLKLAESRSRIQHAVSLYNTYCNEGTALYNPAMKMTRLCVGDGDVMNMWAWVKQLDRDNEPVQGPCPKRIVRAVAKLRATKICVDDVHKLGEEDMEHFCRAGGLEALLGLLCSSNPQSVQMQALKCLGIIVGSSEDMKKRISHVNDNNDNPGALELLGSVVAFSGGDLLREAVGLMRALMKNNGDIDVKKACQPATVGALLKLLVCRSCNLENVLGVLWELSVCEEMNSRMGSCGVKEELLFERLVHLCGCDSSSSPVVEFCAAALLQNLCRDGDMRTRVLSAAGVSEGLLYLIESSDRDDKVVLPIRVKDPNIPILMGWGVSMLDSDWERLQVRGLDLLLEISQSQSILLLHLGAQEGAIPRLVRLLESGSTTVVEKATEVLYMLSMPEENEVKIASHNVVIPRLIALLESDSSTVRGNAVKVLESISFNPVNREKILDQNRSMEKVATLLFHESSAAQSSACSLLWNMSNTSMGNKIRIASIHGVPQRLSDLLLSEYPLVQEKAAGAIMSLSYNGRSRKLIASMVCTFERLIKLLDSITTLVHQNAAGALYNLSISPHNIEAIGSHPRAVPNLLSLLSSKCALVQEYAAGALGNLALIEEMREDMKQMGAIPLLKKLKNNSFHASARMQAKRALENLMV